MCFLLCGYPKEDKEERKDLCPSMKIKQALSMCVFVVLLLLDQFTALRSVHGQIVQPRISEDALLWMEWVDGWMGQLFVSFSSSLPQSLHDPPNVHTPAHTLPCTFLRRVAIARQIIGRILFVCSFFHSS